MSETTNNSQFSHKESLYDYVVTLLIEHFVEILYKKWN